ncbi:MULTISPECIES: VOC family protein [unclassified Amycolatopsis]|uniref:VOC family protein n=1 Tax=unclassified Amycolatopsis TaxID=2618356 RepID=UPI002875CAE1|nr:MULTISPECIES: VOC family protein [unclassified Amycolatopsis]MDS0138352.1 VOC family protein [Amycolatopsis sp. 505]MDS0146371.1 VOC family protein [Amycolatopsis sp. CM201R]
MNLTIHQTFLPHHDHEASLAFYRDTLGFEVRNDVGYGGQHWLTIGLPGQPDTSLVLQPTGAAYADLTEEERRTITDLMAKGSFAAVNLATDDLDGTFERVQAGDAEVVQEPTDQPWGIRDCSFRDPAGNLVRIQQAR